MIRSKRLVLSAMLAMATSVFATAPKAELMEPASLWGKDRMAYHQHVKIYNGLNDYRLDATQWKARGKQMPRLTLMLTEPLKYGNFSRPVEFLAMNVNGMALQDIDPSPEGVKLFNQPGFAGCTMTFDFDGTLIDMDWYMTDSSPLLFCRIRLNPQSDTPLKKATVTLSAVPSGTKKKPNGSLMYGGGYHREARTALTTYKMSYRPQNIKPEDRYLILQDAELQIPQKGVYGPCLIVLGDKVDTQPSLLLRNSWLTTLTFTLNAQTPECIFGLWQGKQALSNQQAAEFARNLKFIALPDRK